MTDRTCNLIAIGISILAILISIPALWLSWSQYSADYDRAVLVQPGALPLTRIDEGPLSFDLEIANTSKSNLQYFLRARSNMGCIDGPSGRPLFIPCGYESQVISLSNTEAGRNTYKHTLTLDAGPGAVAINPLASMSEPGHSLSVEILDASNGRVLYQSECFYRYDSVAKAFGLDQPIIDTSGESDRRQRQCRP